MPQLSLFWLDLTRLTIHKYTLMNCGMKPVSDWIEQLRVFWFERIRRLDKLLESMDE